MNDCFRNASRSCGGRQYGSPPAPCSTLIESTRSTFLRIAGVQPRAWYDEPMCVVVEVRNGPPGRAKFGWIGQHVVFATCALMPRPAYEPAAGAYAEFASAYEFRGELPFGRLGLMTIGRLWPCGT